MIFLTPNQQCQSTEGTVYMYNYRLSYLVQTCHSVAAIQVVQVVRCTRAHDPWGPTSEDQIAIFLKN